MNMQCDQFEQILERQDDAPLPESARAHSESCETCRALVADLREIRDIAMEAGGDGIAPPEHIWIALRNQLEAEGIIHGTGRDTGQASRVLRHGWWTVFQRPALAGSFLALILVAAMAITFRQDSSPVAMNPQLALQQETSPVPSAQSVFKDEVLIVGDDSIPGYQKEDAVVTASIRRNLGIVDNFIAMCEKNVREQPDNQMAREYLYGAYQQKAELLATVTSRSMTGGLQ
jgi:hypothetical protein